MSPLLRIPLSGGDPGPFVALAGQVGEGRLVAIGDPSIFIQRPISLGLLIAALALCVLVALPTIRSKREEAFQEN